ncbi:MAG TPA: DUF4403 family protein [Chitinophagaceae bacterium]|nr:DUF4403 family protein [Chitinophagaceae bacterium]
MNKIRFLLFILLCSFTQLMAQRINPANPDLSPGNFRLDSLPDSELNIPIQIDLKPIYTMAEKSVDTLFTSPGYPNGWVQEACDTRYKYSFRRSKLQMKASGLSLQLGFTGYYKIVGSTRACTNGIALTPWTPPCRCGFDEPERKVNVSFTNSLSLMTNYKVKLDFKRNEPQPLDKCEVCFWGQNITNQVMKGLVAELDAAKKDLDKNYGSTDLKPRMQQIWNQLTSSYNLYGLGWLKMNPRAVHLNRLEAKNDSLYLSLGLSARPIISFEQPVDSPSPVPHISNVATRPGFNIFLDAMLNYDSLSQLMSQQVAGKSFDFKKAFVKKQFIIDSCKIYGGGFDKLIIRLHFSGTNHGVIYLTGQPWYDTDKRVIEIINMDFDIKTKNLLLGSAGWLFDKKITREITKFARFELGGYIDSAKVTINTQLNQEWMPGISSNGTIQEIRLIRMYPMQQHLVIRSNCEGNLQVKVDAGKLSL